MTNDVTRDSVRETFIFLVTYCLVGLIGFGANVLSFSALHRLGMPLSFATGIAFLIGGQVAFVSHDRVTFGRRVVDLDRWQQRWRRLVTGQLVGFLVNWAMANTLILVGGIDTWKIYLAATCSGATVTCLWANYYSHKKGPNIGPAQSPDEHTQE